MGFFSILIELAELEIYGVYVAMARFPLCIPD